MKIPNIKNNILLFQKIIPPYRIEIFRELSNRLGVIICHSKGLKGSSNKPASQEFDFLNERLSAFYYQKKETSLVQFFFPVLFKYKQRLFGYYIYFAKCFDIN